MNSQWKFWLFLVLVIGEFQVGVCQSQVIPMRGRVVDANGNVVVGARVFRTYLENGKDNKRVELSTDAEGIFRMDRKKVRIGFLVLSEDGRLAGVAHSPPGEDSIELQALPFASVSGELIDDVSGEPLNNVELVYSVWFRLGEGAYRQTMHETTTTDAKGRFRFQRVVVGGEARIGMVTERGNRNIVTSSRTLVEFDSENRGNLDLGRVAPPDGWNPFGEIRLQGEVVDVEGNPLIAASVSGFYLNGDESGVEATTDEKGQFSVQRKRIPAVLIVRSKDRELAEVIVSNADEEAVTLVPRPYLTVTGQLVDAESKQPMGNVEIAYRVTYQTGKSMSRTCHLEETTTKADGSFAFDKVIVGGDATLVTIRKRDPQNGMAISFSRIKKFEVPVHENIDLGQISPPTKTKPQTARQRAKALFSVGNLKTRIESSVELIPYSQRRILVVTGKPDDPQIVELLNQIQARQLRAWHDFRALFADPSGVDPANLSAIGIENDAQGPAIHVVGKESRLIESMSLDPLKNGTQFELGELRRFLEKHALQPLDSGKQLNAALQQAKEQNKRVLIQYSSSSLRSKPSDQLTRFFHRNRGWSQDYVWVVLDTRSRDAWEIVQELGGDFRFGMPWLAILDAEGNVLANSELNGPNVEFGQRKSFGFPMKSSEKYHFKKMLMETKIRLTEAEVDELISRLDDSD